MNDYINWGFSELSFEIKGRCKYLKSLPSLTLDEQFELKDVEDRCIKIQEKEDAQDAQDKQRAIWAAEFKANEEKERELKQQDLMNLLRENKNKEAVISDSFRNYVTDLADGIDNKFDNSINLRFLRDIIKRLNNLKNTYKPKIITTDSDFDVKYNMLIKINTDEYVSFKNFVKGLSSFINSIIDKLELQNKAYELSYNETHKIQKNDWANKEVICEHCNKTYLKSHKARHLATKVCQKSRI